MDVDPTARTVRLHPPGSGFADIASGATRVPLTVEGTESFVRASIRPHPGSPAVPVKLHVDTGKRDSISLITGRHPEFTPADTAQTTTSIGISGTTRNRIGRIASLALEGLELEDVKVSYVEASSGAFTNDADGRIGAGLLSRFRYIVDYAGGQLILVPNETSLRDRGRLPRTGLGLFAIGEQLDELVVVRAESAAEAAGVRPGDIVVSIDGIDAAALARGQWPDLLRDKQVGDRLTVCLKTQPDCREIVLTQGV